MRPCSRKEWISLLLLELRPALPTVIWIVLDCRWEGECPATRTAAAFDHLLLLMLRSVFRLALWAVVPDVLPGRIIGDGLATGLAGLYAHLLGV